MASAKAYEAKRQLVVLVFMLFAGVATAQDVGTLQARNKRLKDEIAALEQRIQSTAGTIQGQLTQYRMGQSLLKSRQELIGGIEKELSALNSQITEKTQAVASLRNQHAELLTAYENLLVQAYKHRDKKLWIMHILSSRSASQAYRRWRYFGITAITCRYRRKNPDNGGQSGRRRGTAACFAERADGFA